MDERKEKDYQRWLRKLGKNVAATRMALGWTQQAAAHRCNMDLKFFQDVEYGRRPITTRTLFNLAKSLKSSVRSLVPDEPREKSRKSGIKPRPRQEK